MKTTESHISITFYKHKDVCVCLQMYRFCYVVLCIYTSPGSYKDIYYCAPIYAKPLIYYYTIHYIKATLDSIKPLKHGSENLKGPPHSP